MLTRVTETLTTPPHRWGFEINPKKEQCQYKNHASSLIHWLIGEDWSLQKILYGFPNFCSCKQLPSSSPCSNGSVDGFGILEVNHTDLVVDYVAVQLVSHRATTDHYTHGFSTLSPPRALCTAPSLEMATENSPHGNTPTYPPSRIVTGKSFTPLIIYVTSIFYINILEYIY